MTVTNLDLKGLKCPQPQMEIAKKALYMKPGDTIIAVADCETFEKDVRDLCVRKKAVLLSVRDLGGSTKEVHIQF